MEPMRYRVLDVLARHMGRPLSVSGLADTIGRRHGTGSYANVHKWVEALETEDVVTSEAVGGARLVQLALGAEATHDALAELELERKRRWLAARPGLRAPATELAQTLGEHPTIHAVALCRPDWNADLGRLEVLALMREARAAGAARAAGTARDVWARGLDVGRHHNLRVDVLAVTATELASRMRGGETSLVPHLVSDHIAITFPQAFWSALGRSTAEGPTLRADPEAPPAMPLDEATTVDALRLAGYEERGREVTGQHRSVRVEQLAVSLLLSDEQRRRTAAAVVLAKGAPHPGLLVFLARTYRVEHALAGLVEAVPAKPWTRAAREMLTALGVEPTGPTAERVAEVLETYGVHR